MFPMWLKAVRENPMVVPCGLSFLKEMCAIQNTFAIDKHAILKASLEFMPLVAGDGTAAGSIILKYVCATTQDENDRVLGGQGMRQDAAGWQVVLDQ